MSDKHGPNDDQLLQALEAATVDFHTGNHVIAESVYRGALSSLDERRPELSTCLKNLGEICAARGDFVEAIRLNVRLLALSCSRSASNDAAETMVRLASLYEITGRLQEAEYMFNRAQVLQEQLVWDELKQPGDEQATRPGGQSSVSNLVASSPPWLLQAFDEANKRYGIRQYQPEEPGMVMGYEAPRQEREISFNPEMGSGFGRTRLSETGEAPAQADPHSFHSISSEAAARERLAAFRPVEETPYPQQVSQTPQQEESVSDYFARTRGTGQEQPTNEIGNQGTSQEIRRRGVSQEIRRQAISAPRDKLGHSGSNSKLRQEHQTREFGPVTVPTEDIVRNMAGFWEQAKAMGEFIYSRVGPQYKLSFALIACVGAMLICTATSWLVVPKQKPLTPTKINQQYKSADGDKIFILLNPYECEFDAVGKSMRMSYRAFKGDFKDSVDLALGSFSEKQNWVRHTQDGLQDSDGTILYPAGAPELEFARHMDDLNAQAALVFTQTGHYPDKFPDQIESHLAYTNPFTKKPDMPKLQILTLGSKDSSSQQADLMRQELYVQVRTGQGWKDRADLYPGCIYCCSVQLLSSRGVYNFFLVQPGDKDGKPFTSSLKGERYFTALEDGNYRRFEPPTLPFNGEQGMRHQVTWLIESNLDPGQENLLKHGGAYFYGFLTFLFVIVYVAIRPDLVTKVILVPLIAGALIATIVYTCSGALP